MKRLIVRLKELHTLKYRLHTLNEMIDYQKDNCLVYAVYSNSKKIFHDIWLFLFQRKHNFLAFYLQSSKILLIFAPCKSKSVMETTALNPTQMHLLKLFAFNNSEEYAREIQEVLTRHFQSRLDAEADRLWDEGILNQEKLDEIRKMDLHAK